MSAQVGKSEVNYVEQRSAGKSWLFLPFVIFSISVCHAMAAFACINCPKSLAFIVNPQEGRIDA